MTDTLPQRLGLSSPVVQAPMAGGWTTPAMVAAVAEAGALGMLAGARLTADQIREQIAEVRRRTGRLFGVKFLIPTVLPEDAAGPLHHPVLAEIRSRWDYPTLRLRLPRPRSTMHSSWSVVPTYRW